MVLSSSPINQYMHAFGISATYIVINVHPALCYFIAGFLVFVLRAFATLKLTFVLCGIVSSEWFWLWQQPQGAIENIRAKNKCIRKQNGIAGTAHKIWPWPVSLIKNHWTWFVLAVRLVANWSFFLSVYFRSIG